MDCDVVDALEHRHGRVVHSHPHAGPHRHLAAPRRSVGTPRRSAGTPRRVAPQRSAATPRRHRSSPPRAPEPRGEHDHDHPHDHTHGHTHEHSHGLVPDSVKRSREGIRAVSLSLLVLGLTAVAQTAIFLTSGSVALLADLIHNFGDALTAVPLGIAFALRSRTAETRAGLGVVAAIFISACVAGVEAVSRLVHPSAPSHLGVLALAGVAGFLGNLVAARIRTRAGRRLDSAALIADGDHARADAYVSLAVIASAAAVALGLTVADPLIGLLITFVILRITRESWQTVRAEQRH